MNTSDISLRESDLPATARNLVRLAGWNGAMTLIHQMPGFRIYIPASGAAKGRTQPSFENIAEHIGEAAAERIYDEYRGTALEIPTCRSAFTAARDRRIRERFDAGESIASLCSETGLSRRSIFYILKTVDILPAA